MTVRRRGFVETGVVGGLWLVGWVLVLARPEGVIGGDLPVYYERMEAIEGGGLPYRDAVFEHLPAVLVPMFVARLLSGFGSDFAFAGVFSALMAVCVLLTVRLLASATDETVARRFLLLAAPLVPLVVFRNDPWVTLLAVASLGAGAGGTVAGAAAILAKGWPAVFVARAWFSGARARASVYAFATAVAVVAVLSPGFQATQDSAGIHSETIVGAVLGLIRAVEGSLEVVVTTAAYLPAATWLLLIGPLVAVGFGIAGLVGLRRDPSHLVPLGVLIGAVIVLSPLFSTQYVLWMLPFLAASRSAATRSLGWLVSMMSLAMIVTWNALFEGWAWWGLTVFRNVALLICLVLMAREGLDRQRVVAPSP